MFVIIFLFITFNKDYFLIGAIFLIYILGLLSDINVLSSPSKRILFQTLIIIGYIIFGNLEYGTADDQSDDTNSKKKIIIVEIILIYYY